jgi:ADP-ribose pyrophosphatase YjhB (NUDIX family)
MCISAFAVIEEKGKVLVGVPKRNVRWGSEWGPAWAHYSREDYRDVFRQWRLPSGYLREGEHPDSCIRRIMRDQLGVEKFGASRARVFSYASPSDWYPGNYHWDIVFVYDVALGQRVALKPWWKALRFVGRQELRNAQFGWNDDLMKDLNLVQAEHGQ